MRHDSADYIHTVIEAEKLALADRDEYYADPAFVKAPMQQLLSDQYTKMRRELINPKTASLELRPGDPYNMKPTKPPTITGPWHGGTTVMCCGFNRSFSTSSAFDEFDKVTIGVPR